MTASSLLDHHCKKQSSTQATPSPTSPFQARSSGIHVYIKKRRWWIVVALILVLIAMLLGLILAAQDYYKQMGGQGFLGARQEQLWEESDVDTVSTDPDTANARVNIPYYTCGDQLHSCEAFGQPVSLVHLSYGMHMNGWPLGYLLSDQNLLSGD